MHPASSPHFRSYHHARRAAPHHVIITSGAKIRSFTLRASMLAAAGAAIVLIFGGTIVAAGYMLFRDDITAAPPATDADAVRQIYERRIAELQAELQRASSRRAIDHGREVTSLRDMRDQQEAIAQRQEEIARRQRELVERQKILAGLAGAAGNAGIDLLTTGSTPIPTANPLRASIGTESGAPAAFAEPESGTDEDTPSDSIDEDESDPAEVDQTLGAVEQSIDAVNQQQIAAVESVAEGVSAKGQRLTTALRSIGVRVDDDEDAVGGPYEPIGVDAGLEDFRDSIDYLTDDIGRLNRLADVARRLPLTRPLPGAAMTSRFGRRRDPFLGRPAMHTGIDFRAPQGTTVRATAPGKVTVAGRTGGYGNMVEVDHGNGIRTRYGHMSRILVRVGQTVTTKDILGKVGSTGRSTGPHLHYEVRRGGRAIDPMTFLRAGAEINPLL